MNYWLRAIYEDNNTNLGTSGNEHFDGKDIQRKISNFQKKWQGIKNMAGQKIIGVEVETCTNGKYSDGKIERIVF